MDEKLLVKYSSKIYQIGDYIHIPIKLESGEWVIITIIVDNESKDLLDKYSTQENAEIKIMELLKEKYGDIKESMEDRERAFRSRCFVLNLHSRLRGL